MGVGVVGISKDTVASHKKFGEKFSLNFPILSDPEHKVIEAYGAWGPKKFMGREFLGTHRNTYIVNKSGTIVREYKDVNPLTHTQEVVEDIKELVSKS
jgi:peroxiredoxin Q/BCP